MRIAPNTMPAMAKATANYANSQLIKMEAITNGYHEGIALDHNGRISEGSGENLFLVWKGRLYTPPLSASTLPGITRLSVIQLSRELGFQMEEKTEAIQKSFFDIVEGRVEDRYGWLTPVHAVVAAART